MQNIIARLQELIGEIPRLLSQFSPEEMSQRLAPGRWSKKEILGHLCDSALHNLQRFLYAPLRAGVFAVQRFPQDDLVRQNGYQDLPAGQIAALWASLNRQIVAVWKKMPEAAQEHPVQLPDGKLSTLGWLIENYVVHLEHHLRQIFPEGAAISAVLPARWSMSVEEAVAKLASEPQGKPFISLLEHGNMYVEIYAPKGVDLQQPHDQDELYVVISGSGTFFNNGERQPFSPGDVLFVPAGMEHRFEDFTADFKTWVIFY